MVSDETFFLPAVEIAQLIRTRALSPVELIDALFERIRSRDGAINAYCTLAEESARATARDIERRVSQGDAKGPLLGVPVSIKDNIETAGIRTTYGSRVFRDFIPTEDAVCVERLKGAGAVIIGKTNLPEFAAKGVVDSPLFGRTHNPWDLNLTVGGSSGGAAAAVAAGMGPLAIGNDQAGSIRIPAAFAGVAGLKPTGGRIPFYPNDNPWDVIFQVGPIARTIADLELALRVLEGPDPRDPFSLPMIAGDWESPLEDLIRPWRLAWSPDFGFAEVDATVLQLCREAFDQLAEIGTAESPSLQLGEAEEAYAALVPIRRAAALAEVIDEWEPLMDPFVARYIRSGLAMTVKDLGRGIRLRNSTNRELHRLFAEFDLLVSPAVAVLPFDVRLTEPSAINGKALSSWRAWFPFTYPLNLTGHPAATVPIGWTSDNLPVGLQIVGPRFADREVLAACRRLELIRPWAHRRPDLNEHGSVGSSDTPLPSS